MNKKFGAFFIAIGLVLLVAAGGVAVYFNMEDKTADEESGAVMSELHAEIEKEEQAPSSTDKKKKPVVKTINGYDYLGYLSIPALDLELPVMSGWDYTRLKYAPCRYSGFPSTNDFVIAGHNYRSHFGRFSSLKIGNAVSFTSVGGITYEYEIGDIEILQPTDVDEMISSGWDLTLYTCTPGAAERITIRCKRLN